MIPIKKKESVIVADKKELMPHLNRALPHQLSVTTIPTDFIDRAKRDIVKEINADLSARSKRHNIAVLVLELPTSK